MPTSKPKGEGISDDDKEKIIGMLEAGEKPVKIIETMGLAKAQVKSFIYLHNKKQKETEKEMETPEKPKPRPTDIPKKKISKATGAIVLDMKDISRMYSDDGPIMGCAKMFRASEVSGFGHEISIDSVSKTMNMPYHLVFAIKSVDEDPDKELTEDYFDSIPWYTVCKYYLTALDESLGDDDILKYFGIKDMKRYFKHDDRLSYLRDIFNADKDGLGYEEKVGIAVRNPFLGKRKGIGRRTVINKILVGYPYSDEDRVWRVHSKNTVLQDYHEIGNLGLLASKMVRKVIVKPKMTAKEVLTVMKYFPNVDGFKNRAKIIRSLFDRCGHLEAYWVIEFFTQRRFTTFEAGKELVLKIISEKYKIPYEDIKVAEAISDIYYIIRIADTEGKAGLEKIKMKPLIPIYPQLAVHAPESPKFPLFADTKYDGIRCMGHKDGTMSAWYTRQRHDWTDKSVPLQNALKYLPCHSAILDGELVVSKMDLKTGNTVQGTVYDVMDFLGGNVASGWNLRYIVFDIIFLNGQDLTKKPYAERRQFLDQLILNAQYAQGGMNIMPIHVSNGTIANDMMAAKRIFTSALNKDYEGIILKDFNAPYKAGQRDRSWAKMKDATTLDLVLIGAFKAKGDQKERIVGSYTIGALNPETKSFVDVGSCVSMSKIENKSLLDRITREGLWQEATTRMSSTGEVVGWNLTPGVVVEVKINSVTKNLPKWSQNIYPKKGDKPTEELQFEWGLVSPRILRVRSPGQKNIFDINTTDDIAKLGMGGRFK